MDLDDDELKATRRMNGSDKNVACMEEDVKHIEYVLDLYKENGEFGGRYISGNLFEKDFIAIEHLIKGYKEEKERYKQSKKYREKYIEVTNLYLNSIPKSKIKEIRKRYKQKIEKYYELKNQGKETDVEFYENITNIEIVRVLQELLEGK